MKDNIIYTCYGCPLYYKDKDNRYSGKHCNKDHMTCSYYLGEEVSNESDKCR